MIQYLHSHSRHYLTFAVSQGARFVHGNLRSDEVALERIGKYLNKTLKEGLTFSPTDSLDIDCFVDADFEILWPHEDK